MYSNFQGEGCNFFFEEIEFFDRVATRDGNANSLNQIPPGIVGLQVPELSSCFIISYILDKLTCQMRSMCLAIEISYKMESFSS